MRACTDPHQGSGTSSIMATSQLSWQSQTPRRYPQTPTQCSSNKRSAAFSPSFYTKKLIITTDLEDSLPTPRHDFVARREIQAWWCQSTSFRISLALYISEMSFWLQEKREKLPTKRKAPAPKGNRQTKCAQCNPSIL